MITTTMPRRILLGTVLLTGLAACSSNDPLNFNDSGSGSGGVTVGSANFTESEIIAEVYAQSLEKAGITVKRRMQIGTRDIYVKALKDGSVDLVPEYSGNLLQFFQGTPAASDETSVMAALRRSMPAGMTVGEPSAAHDADSWCVTAEFSQSHKVTSLADLAKLNSFKVGGNPELKERPYGPKGLTKVYGVPASKITFTALSDSSGPLTVKALTSRTVDLVDLYTTTPAIKEQHLVVLSDPKHLIMAQNIVPLMNKKVDDKARKQLAKVSRALTTDDLIAMNQRSQGDEKASAATIAKDWLAKKGLA